MSQITLNTPIEQLVKLPFNKLIKLIFNQTQSPSVQLHCDVIQGDEPRIFGEVPIEARYLNNLVYDMTNYINDQPAMSTTEESNHFSELLRKLDVLLSLRDIILIETYPDLKQFKFIELTKDWVAVGYNSRIPKTNNSETLIFFIT